MAAGVSVVVAGTGGVVTSLATAHSSPGLWVALGVLVAGGGIKDHAGRSGRRHQRSSAHVLIGRVRAELAQVLDELRDLAHGIHPAVLSQVGLDQAVKSIADRYLIPIKVNLLLGRFTEAAELAAYYLIAESITNGVKRALARRITVSGRLGDRQMEITVADEGRGGARVEAGTGIRGIIDRVRAIGGDVQLISPPGQGTRIEAQIPCV